MWLQSQSASSPIAAYLLLLVMARLACGQAASPEQALEEALTALQAGQTGQARGLLEQTVEQWPRFRRAHYQLGRLALDRGDLDAAFSYLEFAAEGEFPRAFSARYYLGRTLILQRRFAEAVPVLDRAIDRAPGFAPALMERGRARLFLGELDAGLADLLATLEHSKPPPQALVLTGQLLIHLGRDDDANSAALRLRDEDEGENRWRQRAGWLTLATEPGPANRAELARSVSESPESGDLYWSLGMVQLETDPELAARLLRTALDHDSENPVSLLALQQLSGEAVPGVPPTALPNLRAALRRSGRLWEEGKYEESREIAVRLLELRPRLVPTRLLLARDAERRGDLWQAAALYEGLLDELGIIPSVGHRLAQVAQTMGTPELALCGVQMALSGSADDASLFYLLGVIQGDSGNVEAAIQAHERALELGSEDARSWLRLGEIYFEQMRISDSIAAYAKAMALDPAAAEAVRSFALSSLTTEQYSSVRQVLEIYVQEHPEDVNTLYSLGVMSLRDNQLDGAEEYFLKLAEVAPDHRQVHYSLGQIYLRQGDTAAGQAEMERFRRIKTAEDQDWERHNLSHFRRVEARRLVEAGRSEEAIPLYTQSVTEGTAELSDYLELASANLSVGRMADAMRGFEGVLATYPYHHEALEGLRLAATQHGDSEQSQEAIGKLAILDWPCKMNLSQ